MFNSKDYLKRTELQMCLIFCASITLRIIALFLLGEGANVSMEYGEIANNLLTQDRYSMDFYNKHYLPSFQVKAFMPPLYPIMIYIAERINPFSNLYALIKIIQVLASSLSCLLIYFIAGKIFADRRIGLLAAWIMAFYPAFVLQTVKIMPTTMEIFLLACGLLSFMRLVEIKDYHFFSCFIWATAIALLTLSRPYFILLPPIFLFILWLNDIPIMRLRTVAIVSLSFFILLLLPWLVRNYNVTGHPFCLATNGGFNLWIGNNPFATGSGWLINKNSYEKYTDNPVGYAFVFPDGTAHPESGVYPLPNSVNDKIINNDGINEIELDSLLFKEAFQFIVNNPMKTLHLGTQKFKYFWLFKKNMGAYSFDLKPEWIFIYKIQYALLLVLSILAVWFFRNKWKKLLAIYSVFALMTAICAVFFANTRYRLLIEPYLILLFSAGTIHLIDLFKKNITAPSQWSDMNK